MISRCSIEPRRLPIPNYVAEDISCKWFMVVVTLVNLYPGFMWLNPAAARAPAMHARLSSQHSLTGLRHFAGHIRLGQ